MKSDIIYFTSIMITGMISNLLVPWESVGLGSFLDLFLPTIFSSGLVFIITLPLYISHGLSSDYNSNRGEKL